MRFLIFTFPDYKPHSEKLMDALSDIIRKYGDDHPAAILLAQELRKQGLKSSQIDAAMQAAEEAA